ncbi:MAG: DMT family transporter [Bacteroidales bacterium]
MRNIILCMLPQKKAYLFAISAIAFWSTMGSAFKITLGYISYSNLLLFTSLISLLVTGCIIVFFKSWKQIVKTSGRDWMMSAIMGFLNPFGYYVILFKAYSLITAQEAVALNYTWPLVLVILSIPVLKQKIRFTSIMAIVVSFTGALLVVTKGDFSFLSVNNPLGSLLALGSSVIWASFWLLNLKDRRNEEIKLFMNFIFGFIFSLIYALAFTEIRIPSGNGLYGVLYIGIFEMGITFFLWLKALHYSQTTARVTKLVYLSPFLSLLFIHFLVGENIHLTTWLGLALIIGGIVTDTLTTRKTQVN